VSSVTVNLPGWRANDAPITDAGEGAIDRCGGNTLCKGVLTHALQNASNSGVVA
jgi:hypothetical protein